MSRKMEYDNFDREIINTFYYILVDTIYNLCLVIHVIT